MITLDEIKKRAVLSRLRKFGYNRTLAAESLGVSRRGIGLMLATWTRADPSIRTLPDGRAHNGGRFKRGGGRHGIGQRQ